MTVTYMFRAMHRQAEPEGKASPAPRDADADPSDPPAAPDAVAGGGGAEPPPLTGSAAAPDPARQISRYVATQGRIILVAKARGGIGATTLAVNLALEMHLQAARRSGAVGGRVALVDLDVQLGNAGSFLDLPDRGGMLAIARLGPEPDVQAVRHALVRHASGLGVLAAPATAIPLDAFDAARIASLLEALAQSHDVVVVDLPPALIDWLDPILKRAERLLMVTDLAVPSLARAHRLLALMTEDHPDLPVEIVVSQEKKPFRPGTAQRDAAVALGHELRHWLPEEGKLARQALDRGEPLVQLAPRCGWSKALKQMATDLQTRPKAGTGTTARRMD